MHRRSLGLRASVGKNLRSLRPQLTYGTGTAWKSLHPSQAAPGLNCHWRNWCVVAEPAAQGRAVHADAKLSAKSRTQVRPDCRTSRKGRHQRCAHAMTTRWRQWPTASCPVLWIDTWDSRVRNRCVRASQTRARICCKRIQIWAFMAPGLPGQQPARSNLTCRRS